MLTAGVEQKTGLSKADFRRRLLYLVLATWNIPPVFGLSFLVYIQVFTLDHVMAIMSQPLLPGYILFFSIFTVWYFNRLMQPVMAYLDSPAEAQGKKAAAAIRKFPLHYWGMFLAYLVFAPVVVITSAEIYTSYIAQPIDWFRVELVALIVSIIVGLPIFFLVLDLFGRVMTSVPLEKPHVTIKMKVFLIGALIPLLIDTMLVQYYWTRTGFFNMETFIVWLALELLAIGGSLIFVKSFGQSLAPLNKLSHDRGVLLQTDIDDLGSQSTDELGVLSDNYRKLLRHLLTQSEMLELSNRLLSKTGYDISMQEIAGKVVRYCMSALEADNVFLVLHDESMNELVGVAHNGVPYKEDGHYRISMHEPSMAGIVYKSGEVLAVNDVQTDPRCSSRMRERFKVKSALSAPLIVGKKPIGVLMSVSNSVMHDYSKREIAVIEGFAREAALAIHTHRLNLSRNAAERRGMESESKYRSLFESAGVAIFLLKNGVMVDCNQKTLGLLNCSREDVLGKTAEDMSPKYQPDGQISKYKADYILQQVTMGNNQFYEWMCLRPDGSHVPVEATLSRLDVGGEVFVQVVMRDISERKQTEELIHHMAYHDSLTGLVNRHEFENRMNHALESVKKRGGQHALLYLDLDQFKLVNDSCGHDAGDELLKQLSRLIHGPVRERDTLARLGGDEFGILLENCPADRAEQIAGQIVRLVRDYRFNWHGRTFSVGASIGIAMLDDSATTAGDVLKTADMACYRAKELGRNRVHLFTPGDTELLKRETEMSLVSHIHDALDNNRFVLFSQPITSLHNDAGKKKYNEVLVRMMDETGKIEPAATFVSSAERFNLMPDIDRWVIRKTFAYAAGMARSAYGDEEHMFFINLSGTSFNDDSFYLFVRDELVRQALDPARICFEVTETAAIANIKQAQKFISAVKALGCRFALDDFGSGLSSFSYLKDLDVDFLKIDGSFVRDILHDEKDYSIVEAITQLGRSMGILTIAEFVENQEIMQKVSDVGVDFAQGYGIGKSVPLGERDQLPHQAQA